MLPQEALQKSNRKFFTVSILKEGFLSHSLMGLEYQTSCPHLLVLSDLIPFQAK